MSIEGNNGRLVASDKFEGTAVFGPDDQKVGMIERVTIEKTSGRVSYAVLGFGAFLGLGNDHFLLPWNSLKYDTAIGGASESSWDWHSGTEPNRSMTTMLALPGHQGRGRFVGCNDRLGNRNEAIRSLL